MSNNDHVIEKPIVGVLVGNNYINKILKRQNLPRANRYQAASQSSGVFFYFFSLKDINVKNKTVEGVYFNTENKLWEKKQFPYPRYIYKKVCGSKNNSIFYKNFKKELEEKSIETLNYIEGFNKWEVYQNLSKDKNFNEYLPQTIIYNNPSDIENMFKKSDRLYLKACRGGRGRQVVRITKLPSGSYEFSHFNKELYIQKFQNLNRLINKINRFFGDRKFIIQEAIDLITINKKIVDLRAEVQRNGNGEIEIVAVPVRVSKKNSPITTHAQSFTFDYFFKKILKYKKKEFKELKTKLNHFLTTAYTSIEKVYGPICEIGIDVGLDKKGRLWFIECNSRSLKVSFFKAYNDAAIAKSFSNIFEYANYKSCQDA